MTNEVIVHSSCALGHMPSAPKSISVASWQSTR